MAAIHARIDAYLAGPRHDMPPGATSPGATPCAGCRLLREDGRCSHDNRPPSRPEIGCEFYRRRAP